MTNPQEKTSLEKFLQDVQDLYSELFLANLHRWHNEFKIEKDESMLYKHIHLTPREHSFIVSPLFENVRNICIKHEKNFYITISIEVRPLELVMPDNRYFMVQQPSINIQISQNY